MGPRDMLQAIREYPAACARLETAQRELNQAQKALEKSELECQRLSGDYSEARRRANFSEKKSAALQAALDAYCPKLSSLAEMIRFYETVSPSLDPQVSTPTGKCHFSPGWDVIFWRSACDGYAALITRYLSA